MNSTGVRIPNVNLTKNNMAKENKKETYNLIIDKGRDQLLNMFMQLGLRDTKFTADFLRDKGLIEEFSVFSKEIAEKNHLNGWCEDPECAWVDPRK